VPAAAISCGSMASIGAIIGVVMRSMPLDRHGGDALNGESLPVTLEWSRNRRDLGHVISTYFSPDTAWSHVMRRPPPPHLAGSPKTPGSGRRPGSLNRKTVELRALLGALAGDVSYQHRLREDFRKRRVHPSIEALVWAYSVGKPVGRIDMSATMSTDKKLAAERQVFERLTVDEQRDLAQESETLRKKAHAMAARRHPIGLDDAER
jgi:hypothetical protein